MRPTFLLLFLAASAFAQAPFGIAVHGGAGNIMPERIPPGERQAYRDGLERALAAGYAVLDKGGTALDAVEAAVRVLEDDPHFNAGLGATFTRAGTHELDASIMDGRTLKAGAVAAVQHVKNPVSLARLVMDRSPHVLLVGEGAEAFGRGLGVAPVANESLTTPAQAKALEAFRAREAAAATKDTVGAVALDKAGNLAAATSTGGMLGKLPGRVGDSPIVGAGVYANNATCAVSCTGWGEFLIRTSAAYDISARMAYQALPLAKAAQASLDQSKAMGGDGGLIALDAKGHVTMPFNTPGMFRGCRLSDGTSMVKLFKDE